MLHRELTRSYETESVEFSESESIIMYREMSLLSIEVQSPYSIMKVYRNVKMKNKNAEIISSEYQVIVEIVNVQFCPVKHVLRTYRNRILTNEMHESIKERTIQMFNPYIYEIKLEHGPSTWTVFRRYNEFVSVHDQVLLRVAGLKLPFPTKKAKSLRSSFKEESRRISVKVGRKKRTLPPFPRNLEILVSRDEIDARKELLANYLQAVVGYKLLRNVPELLKFFEISKLSFVNSLGIKRKEGVVWKRCGGRHVFTGCLDFINHINYRWKSRWLLVKDTFIAYIDCSDSRIGDVMLMDNKFTLIYGEKETGKHAGISILNKHRMLACDCHTICRMKEWVEAIQTAMITTGIDFIQCNKNDSFAPLRPETYCKWYIDGDDYMDAVGNAMESAAEEIYIADWWLSPQIHLKRPASDNYWRLDSILLRKAEEGVLVFILLFKEIEMALNVNSHYTKAFLSKLHKNIQVLRHPDHLRRRILLWSHHEKIVVIDQKIGFIGGIDLCYGRWDTPSHPINDVSECSFHESATSFADYWRNPIDKADTIHLTNTTKKSFFGRSFSKYSNKGEKVTKKSQISKDLPKVSNINTLKVPDPSDLSSPPLTSNGNNNKYMANMAVDIKPNKKSFINWPPKIKNNHKKSLNKNNSRTSHSLKEAKPQTLYKGKDYVNWIVKDCVDVDHPDIDLIDRYKIPRMPWHDISCEVFGRAARDAARHFIQRWNAVKKEKANKKHRYNILVPKGYIHSEVQKHLVIDSNLCTCQILRSVSEWSANIDSTESSILNAYIDTIRKAKHYIYIENQFFISTTNNGSEVIKNTICKEILARILHFHRKSKMFKVYILLPLLPAFESEMTSRGGASLYTVQDYNYKSLFRSENSLFSCLKKHNINPSKYVSLGSLRNYGFIGEKLVTEQIYIHSKMIIVDDLYVIIGSANLNDRSMLGFRDSEIAVMFRDEEFIKVTFNGSDVKVGKFASSLRKSLMMEHLGVTENNDDNIAFFDLNLLNDPVQDSFFVDIWCSTAINNTQLYDDIFACKPSDKFKSFSDFLDRKNLGLIILNPELAITKVQLIRGHLVVFPTEFLVNENLEPSFVTKEGMMPSETWT